MLEDVVSLALVIAIVLMIVTSIVASVRRRKHQDATIAAPVYGGIRGHVDDHHSH